MEERITVSLRLTPDAHWGLSRACQTAGITMTAMAEAMGLAAQQAPRSFVERWPDIIDAARLIDQERRNRR